MKIKNQTQQSEPAQATLSMKLTGKIVGVAAAISLCVIAYQSDYRASELQPVALDGYVVAATTAIASELASSNEIVDRHAVALPSAVMDSWMPEPLVSVAAATLDSAEMGPPVSEQPAAEKTEKTQETAPRDKMSGPVAALALAGGPELAEIVVRYDQHPELFDDEIVAALGGEVTRSFKHLDMRAIRLPAASLLDLAADDNVDWLSIDDKMSLTSASSRGAAHLPAAGSANAGYDGSDVGVAVLDTGVSAHADLSANIVQYSFLNGAYPTPTIVNGQITALNDSPREDLFGHGTHVAGIVTGSGIDSEDEFKGPATGATVLSLQVLDGDGGGSMSDVMAALDWLQTYGSYFDIRVVNLSLGKGISESNTTDPLVIAVEDLWDAGMVVVVAAGNDGNAGSMTINSPGNSRKVITVGSLTDNGTGANFNDDSVSSFSSTGPTVGDLVLKPDLVAPGNRIVAAIPGNSLLANSLPGRKKGCKKNSCSSEYLEMSGTSMATPMVSAAVALILDKDPSLSPATVKARLMRTALKIGTDPAASGAGLLDVDAAMNDSGTVAGQALSPLMILDELTDDVLVENTADLWGDAIWGSGYLYSGGFNWAAGYSFTDENGVTANGYMWTDGGGVGARGYMWTDGGVSAKGYMWTDGVNAKSLLDSDGGTGFLLNDDAPTE